MENSHQLRLIARDYPFEYVIERSVSYPAAGGRRARENVDTIRFGGAPVQNYLPGRVLALERAGAQTKLLLDVPTLVDFAEAAFQDAHCFDYAGISDETGQRALRVDFCPADRIDAPDVEGTILLDTATFQIIRVTASITHVDRMAAISGIRATTTTSYYSQIAPAVSMLNLLISDNTVGAPVRGMRTPEREIQRVLAFRFGKEKPAGVNRAPPSKEDGDAYGPHL